MKDFDSIRRRSWYKYLPKRFRIKFEKVYKKSWSKWVNYAFSNVKILKIDFENNEYILKDENSTRIL